MTMWILLAMASIEAYFRKNEAVEMPNLPKGHFARGQILMSMMP